MRSLTVNRAAAGNLNAADVDGVEDRGGPAHLNARNPAEYFRIIGNVGGAEQRGARRQAQAAAGAQKEGAGKPGSLRNDDLAAVGGSGINGPLNCRRIAAQAAAGGAKIVNAERLGCHARSPVVDLLRQILTQGRAGGLDDTATGRAEVAAAGR